MSAVRNLIMAARIRDGSHGRGSRPRSWWVGVAVVACLCVLAVHAPSAGTTAQRAPDGSGTTERGAPGSNAPAAGTDRPVVAGPGFLLGRSVFGNGGAPAAGGGYRINGTVGQVFVYGPASLGPDNMVCSGWWCVELSTVLAGPDPNLPGQIEFGRPFPNPGNGNMTMNFALPREGRVDVQLLDVMGRQIRALASRRFEAGTHALGWDGRNASGGPVGAGVYFMRIRVDGRDMGRRRVVVIR